MARERLVGSNSRCGRGFSVLIFVWLDMSDVPEEEEMVRYWYRKEKTGAGLRLGCVRITEMKRMMSFLESKSYSLPTYL